MTFVLEPLGQFQQKIAKSILRNGELKTVKMNGHAVFQERKFWITKNTLANWNEKKKSLNYNFAIST